MLWWALQPICCKGWICHQQVRTRLLPATEGADGEPIRSVHLSPAVFLWPPSVELSIAGVANRARHGGHNVPESSIRRRFARGLHNLFREYAPLVGSWRVFNSSTPEPRLIFSEESGKLNIVSPSLDDRIRREASVL